MYTVKTKELQQKRKDKNLSQVTISELLNMEQTTYSKIETGRSGLKIDIAYKLANILDVDLDDIIELPKVHNELKENTFNDSNVSISGSVITNTTEQGLMEKFITLLDEMIGLIRKNKG